MKKNFTVQNPVLHPAGKLPEEGEEAVQR